MIAIFNESVSFYLSAKLLEFWPSGLYILDVGILSNPSAGCQLGCLLWDCHKESISGMFEIIEITFGHLISNSVKCGHC